jgi:hypothetical protein
MTKIKYSESARCPKCGGMIAYDARMTHRLPIGFGFHPGSARFQIDFAESKGWRGECMQCRELVFAITKTRHVAKYPRRLNRQLQAAAA